jgi:hypothetical protein
LCLPSRINLVQKYKNGLSIKRQQSELFLVEQAAPPENFPGNNHRDIQERAAMNRGEIEIFFGPDNQ